MDGVESVTISNTQHMLPNRPSAAGGKERNRVDNCGCGEESTEFSLSEEMRNSSSARIVNDDSRWTIQIDRPSIQLFSSHRPAARRRSKSELVVCSAFQLKIKKMWNILVAISAVLLLAEAKSVSQVQISNRIDSGNDSAVTVDKAARSKSIRSDIQELMTSYRKLRAKKSETDMRIIATVGLVSGALKLQDEMTKNLHRLATELVGDFNASTPHENMDKLLAIEETMEHDKASIEVMNSILGFARNAKTFDEFQKDMKRILKDVSDDRTAFFHFPFSISCLAIR